MKRLLLIRHAKSSWEDSTLADLERPLNARGLRAAPQMGKRLRERLSKGLGDRLAHAVKADNARQTPHPGMRVPLESSEA